MVEDALFDDLPPPTNTAEAAAASESPAVARPATPPAKSAIKRPLSQPPSHEDGSKRVRFKTTVEASSLQVADAMRKITAHIGNPAKFSKASKLALQLVQSGSLTTETADLFFEILRASMASPVSATELSLRQDYHNLFSAVSEQLQCFSTYQQAQLQVWLLWTQVANDFYTDDTFVFSKAANRIKQEILALPEASASEDAFEAATADQLGSCLRDLSGQDVVQGGEAPAATTEAEEVENDPFGLNALLSKPSRKEERANKRREVEAASKRAQENEENLLRERREALMVCLETAARHYRFQWAQTIIDILVKHASDNVSKFTAQQRDAIEKLWGSVREQQVRRKQGKSATGKLDVTAFERFQKQYSQAKISIRHSVGADGDRSAEQWLG